MLFNVKILMNELHKFILLMNYRNLNSEKIKSLQHELVLLIITNI